jgi:hypothetical protein
MVTLVAARNPRDGRLPLRLRPFRGRLPRRARSSQLRDLPVSASLLFAWRRSAAGSLHRGPRARLRPRVRVAERAVLVNPRGRQRGVVAATPNHRAPCADDTLCTEDPLRFSHSIALELTHDAPDLGLMWRASPAPAASMSALWASRVSRGAVVADRRALSALSAGV